MGFRFEHTYQMPIEEYVRLQRVFTKFSKPWRSVAFLVLGVSALFSKWTFLLGCLILLGTAVSIIAPSMVNSAARDHYRKMPDLEGPISYSVSDEGLSFSATHVSVSCAWPNLVQWRETDGWLIFDCAGVPRVFFRTSDLKEAGVFDSVMRLAMKHGIDYNHPKVRT